LSILGATTSDLTSGASIPEATHHHASFAGSDLHYVSAGSDGTPVLLLHGFPESWWAFHKLIPLLAAEHRVIAVDLPGFGDSGNAPGNYSSARAAETLRYLLDDLALGPVHLSCQDISGASAFRLADGNPQLIRSLAAIESGLPGFGLEMLADVTHGGAWHIGVLAASGIPELLLAGREREFLAGYAYPSMCATAGAITETDVDEFTRTFARPGGFRGATGLYSSMLSEGAEIREMVSRGKLRVPVLAVGAGGGQFTYETMTQVADDVRAIGLDGIGHYVAMEAPDALAEALISFYQEIDSEF
jgi:pimeloyl-ACP methyl ester carboxylesterase